MEGGTGGVTWNTVWREVTELYMMNMASAMFDNAVLINCRCTSCCGVKIEEIGGASGVCVSRSFTAGDDLGGSSCFLPELSVCLQGLLTERLFSAFLFDEKLTGSSRVLPELSLCLLTGSSRLRFFRSTVFKIRLITLLFTCDSSLAILSSIACERNDVSVQRATGVNIFVASFKTAGDRFGAR